MIRPMRWIPLLLSCAVAASLLPAASGEPASLLFVPLKVDISQPPSPFLLLVPQEIQTLKARIAAEPAARAHWQTLLSQCEKFLQTPLRFPKEEGGWTHHFLCSQCSSGLSYRAESPHDHLCPSCKETRQGPLLDQAWNTFTFHSVAQRLEQIGAASLLTGDPRWAQELKSAWLDIAQHYPDYRLHEKNMKFGPDAPSTAGRALSQSIDESHLITKLAYSWDALLASGCLTPQEQSRIQSRFWQTANTYYHRVLDLHGSGGNWWVWHASGAMATGVFTGDIPLMDQALNHPQTGILAMLAQGYINEEGLVEERSAGYQGYALEALLCMTHMAQRVGIPLAANPRVSASVTAMTDLRLADLSLPCMNDSWRLNLGEVSGGGMYWDLLDLGWNLYQSPAIRATLEEIATSPEAVTGRSERLYSFIYGPGAVTPLHQKLPSVFLPRSGVALLRSGDNQTALFLKSNPRPQGHAHPDALQIGLFANGEDLLPAFGTPGYGSKFYKTWFDQSLSANTLVVNQISQNLARIDNSLDWAITGGKIQAAYGQSRRFQRESAQPGQPLAMSRCVLITPLASYEMLRVREHPQNIRKGVTYGGNQLDAVLHFNGKLTWQTPPTPASLGELPSEASLQAEFQTRLAQAKAAQAKSLPKFEDPFAPYRLLEDPRTLAAPKGAWILGTLKQPKGGQVSLALFPPVEGETLYQVSGPGYERHPTERVPMVLRRLSANTARFGSLYVPGVIRVLEMWHDTPTATALCLETQEGREILLASDSGSKLELPQVSFSGTLGVISQKSGGAKIYTLRGEFLADAAGRLDCQPPGAVEMTLAATGPVFVHLSQEPVKVSWTPADGQKPTTRELP